MSSLSINWFRSAISDTPPNKAATPATATIIVQTIQAAARIDRPDFEQKIDFILLKF